MGFAVFSPSVLANNMNEILPRAWRNEQFVKWDPENGTEGPSRVWLYKFWQEVSLL
ncbi:unnamed protein product, partial [Heterosigma akashiwo]